MKKMFEDFCVVKDDGLYIRKNETGLFKRVSKIDTTSGINYFTDFTNLRILGESIRNRTPYIKISSVFQDNREIIKATGTVSGHYKRRDGSGALTSSITTFHFADGTRLDTPIGIKLKSEENEEAHPSSIMN